MQVVFSQLTQFSNILEQFDATAPTKYGLEERLFI
jgi:hypothetical protein